MIENIEIDPKIKVREVNDLLVCPQVVRVKSFTEDALHLFSHEMSMAHYSGQPIIPIVIDSYGGDAYALFSMVDIIRTAKRPVATIVEGKAMSCGAVLFTCGAEGYRFMGPNATLMLHDVSTEDMTGKAEDVKVGAKETGRLNRRMWKLMEQNVGQPNGYLWKQAQARGRTDWYMDPKEALRHNIANHIRVPSLRTVIRVDTVLE